jgi:hypothetical protein
MSVGQIGRQKVGKGEFFWIFYIFLCTGRWAHRLAGSWAGRRLGRYRQADRWAGSRTRRSADTCVGR